MALLPLPRPCTTGFTRVSPATSLEIIFAEKKTAPEIKTAVEADPAPVTTESDSRKPVQDEPPLFNEPVDGLKAPDDAALPPERRAAASDDQKAVDQKEADGDVAADAAFSNPRGRNMERASPADRPVDDPAAREINKPVVPAAPRYRDNPPPDYPRAARRRGHEGLVMLSVNVGVDGKAQAVEVKETSGFDLLDRAALLAVREWRFDPATRGGAPVEMTVDVPVRFELREDSW